MNTPLTPVEEARMDHLWEQRKLAEAEFWKLKAYAKAAVVRRNLQARLVKKLQAEWLPLAERKHGK